MPDIKITKLKFRRGANSMRGDVTYDQGEPVYTTDTHRLFVGNGTPGSESIIGSKIHPILVNYSSLTDTVAEVGDIVPCNNKFYLLTASNYGDINSWSDVSLKIDTSFFNYTSTNTLSVTPNSIDSFYLKQSTIGNGIKVESGVLQSDFQTKSIEISANKISIKESGIDEREISTSALSSGIKGGSGSKIELDVDPTYFTFSGNTLTLSAAPIDLTFGDLSPTWFGDGLYYDSGNDVITATLVDTDDTTISRSPSGVISINPSMFGDGLTFNTSTSSVSSVLASVDNISLVKTTTGVVSMSSNTALSGTNEWAQISVDKFGRVVDKKSSIKTILQGDSPSGTFNDTNSLSSLFNGTPTGIYGGTGTITQFTALSGAGLAVVNLSSAGFITFEGNTTTRDGDTIPSRFAIPIFKY